MRVCVCVRVLRIHLQQKIKNCMYITTQHGFVHWVLGIFFVESNSPVLQHRSPFVILTAHFFLKSNNVKNDLFYCSCRDNDHRKIRKCQPILMFFISLERWKYYLSKMTTTIPIGRFSQKFCRLKYMNLHWKSMFFSYFASGCSQLCHTWQLHWKVSHRYR